MITPTATSTQSQQRPAARMSLTCADIDETWPRLPYRLAITGLFLAQLAYEAKQGKERVQ